MLQTHTERTALSAEINQDRISPTEGGTKAHFNNQRRQYSASRGKFLYETKKEEVQTAGSKVTGRKDLVDPLRNRA